jgi:signal transduction histidine kinase/FixJ family two-component response regulator
MLSNAPTLTLRARLSRLIAFCAGLTALLCMLAVVGTGWWLQDDHAREEATAIGRTMSYALQAPVAFEDRKGIADALAPLRAQPQVSGAWVYADDGRLLGHYGRGEPPRPGQFRGSLAAGYLISDEPVEADGMTVGRMVLVHELDHLWKALATALLAIALGSLAGFAASVWLAQRIARAIVQPIATLAQAADAITTSHDYSRRLPAGGRDEVGAAVNAFNGMLDEIRLRGDALLDANRDLEQRVADRTLALQREKERAEAASIAKTRFLANMSHELRTPLNAVIGAAQLLQDGGGSPDHQSYLVSAIHDGGTKLLGQIENILDLSRIETGALELSIEDFNLVDCVEAAMATASVTAHVKRLEVACIVDPRVAPWRRGDPMRLRQVLLNVLGNALKFTLQGEVVLRVLPGDGPDGLHISVSDTGIGIGAASLAQVFEPFRQADDSANRRFGGTGLGLAISRQLVEAMGGRLTVRSELGAGSIFTVTLDLPAAQQPGADAPPLGHTVLFFEPQEASASALAAQLARLGSRAVRCRTPQELRDWLSAHGADAATAWLMVALDGDACGGFLEASAGHIDARHVIGMCAGEPQSSQVIRQRFDVTRNVIKPVLRAALVSRLGALPVAGPALQAPARTLNAAQRARLKQILVVEDDVVNHTIVCSMLSNAGYLTCVASDGASALQQLSSQAFDLVLMDWQMPDMDGLEVTRRLRAGAVGPLGKVVPIVALTANAFAEDRAACLAAGMNDFLTKPVLAQSLQTTVARWIGGASRRATNGERTTRPAPLSI